MTPVTRPLPPGLAGYLQAVQQNQAQSGNQIQQAVAAMGLQQAMQKQAQEQAYRTGLRPDMTQEQMVAHAARFASPDKVLDINQKSLDRKDAAEQRATQFAETLNLRQQALEDRKEAALAKITDAREKEQFNQWYKQQALTLQQQQAAFNREMKALGLEITKQGNELKLERFNAAERQARDRSVQQLGTALERASLPEADAVLRNVEERMKKTPEIAEYLSGPKSLLPDLAVSQDVREGRQAFQKLFNITLKNRSGAAVTNQELDRLKQEFATGALKTPEQLQSAVTQARKIISDHYKSVAAGFGPDVLKAYNSNLREIGGSPLLESDATPAPTPTPGLPRVASDADYDKLPRGAEFIDPTGKKRRKP